MRFACLWIEHLPAKVELERRPHLRGRPLIVAEGSGPRRVVLDASAGADGAVPGMPLAEALAECKSAVLVEPDPASYRRVFDAVLDAVEALGADVEEAEEEGSGLAYARVSGLELLFGGEARLAAALLGSVPAYLEPRLGVAGNKFAARVAADLSRPGEARRLPDDAGETLAPLAVDLLPVPWETRARLKGFGLSTLGAVAALPPGPLQSQFGSMGKRIWDLSRGLDSRPLVPRRHEQVVDGWLSFPVPTTALGAIVTAIDSLLERILADPAMRGRFARVCSLEASVFRAPRWQRRLVFREPIGDRRRAVALIQHALQGQPPPGPLEDLRIVLSRITGEGGRQESLFSDARRRENLKEALQQLRARLGTQPPVYHVREVEPWSRLPERRQALVPYAP